MFEAFLKIVEPEEQLQENVVYDRLDILEQLGCDRIILMAWEVHRHRSFWDIVDHINEETDISQVVAFTQGTWITGDAYNKAYSRDIEYVVPVDFVNPFEDEILGAQNYSRPSQKMLQRYPMSEAWQTVMAENSRQVQQFMQQFEWQGHAPPGGKYGSIPDEMASFFEENEIDIYSTSRWLFVYRGVNHLMGYPERYTHEIIENAMDVAGTLYIDIDGFLRPPLDLDMEKGPRIESIGEGDLREYASETESAWKGR